MSNNINTIITNLTSIITGLGYNIEDLSDDTVATTTPVCMIMENGVDYEEGFGGGPLYPEALFDIYVIKTDALPSDARDSQATIIHALRDAITIDALNIGDYSTSKLINSVNHTDNSVEYDTPVSVLTYSIKIKYRED